MAGNWQPALPLAASRAIPFAIINRRGQPDYCADMQRHHLLPRQARRFRSLRTMLGEIDPFGQLIGDFRCNGLLLPATDRMARHTRLPLHRGPHRQYSDMVLTRMAQIERQWLQRHGAMAQCAARDARFRLRLLQRALVRNLVDPQPRPCVPLNQRDPFRVRSDPAGTSLDDLAAMLWIATQSGD